jgi:hypothetical protein
MPLGNGGSLPWVVNCHISNILESAPRVRSGSLADICAAIGHVCFTPESDTHSVIRKAPRTVALHPSGCQFSSAPLAACIGAWSPRLISSSGTARIRKACSSDILPHQNQLVFLPACSPSRDGSRVEPVCSLRRCKQSVAVQQWQPSCYSCGA